MGRIGHCRVSKGAAGLLGLGLLVSPVLACNAERDRTVFLPIESTESTARWASVPTTQKPDQGRTRHAGDDNGQVARDAGPAADAGSLCSAEQLRCDGQVLLACSQSGFWQQVEECSTVQLCQDTATQCRVAPEVCNSTAPACLVAVCEKFERRCIGTHSEMCNSGRTGFELLRDCGTPCSGSVCDPAEGCRQQFCDEGDVICEGTVEEGPSVCNAECTAFEKPKTTAIAETLLFCDNHNAG